MKKITVLYWKTTTLLAGTLLIIAPTVAAQAATDAGRSAPKSDAANKNRWTAEDVEIGRAHV